MWPIAMKDLDTYVLGAWCSVVVKTLRYKSEGLGIDSRCRPGIFPVASDSSMCPGVDSACESEYQGFILG